MYEPVMYSIFKLKSQNYFLLRFEILEIYVN